jgi:hypothetical protein
LYPNRIDINTTAFLVFVREGKRQHARLDQHGRGRIRFHNEQTITQEAFGNGTICTRGTLNLKIKNANLKRLKNHRILKIPFYRKATQAATFYTQIQNGRQFGNAHRVDLVLNRLDTMLVHLQWIADAFDKYRLLTKTIEKRHRELIPESATQ